MSDEYVLIRARVMPLGNGWSEGEAICISTGRDGCAYVSPSMVVRESDATRDQFAMAALTGILAQPEHVSDVRILVGSAYQFADAMMHQRESGL